MGNRSRNLIDPDVTFEMFGEAQNDWFRDYSQAIRHAIRNRLGSSAPDSSPKPRNLENG
jgi:hypothetical protein